MSPAGPPTLLRAALIGDDTHSENAAVLEEVRSGTEQMVEKFEALRVEGVRSEGFVLPGPHPIRGSAGNLADDQRVLLPDLDEYRHLPEHAGGFAISDKQRLAIFPVDKVLRMVKQRGSAFFFDCRTDDEVVALALAPHKRIAELRKSMPLRRLGDNGVPAMLGEMDAIFAEREADAGSMSITAGVEDR